MFTLGLAIAGLAYTKLDAVEVGVATLIASYTEDHKRLENIDAKLQAMSEAISRIENNTKLAKINSKGVNPIFSSPEEARHDNGGALVASSARTSFTDDAYSYFRKLQSFDGRYSAESLREFSLVSINNIINSDEAQAKRNMIINLFVKSNNVDYSMYLNRECKQILSRPMSTVYRPNMPPDLETVIKYLFCNDLSKQFAL